MSAATPRRGASAAAAGDALDAKRKILVVDDAPMFREMETVFLGRYGNVITASDGPQALERARLERPDLIVTDLWMQEMHGDALCREIRHDPDLRRLPVVLVTSGAAEEHELAVLAGADAVVEKPLQRSLLLQAVNRILRTTVRSLERVPLETEVRLSTSDGETWGWSRNVSRGGMFVEAERDIEPDTEIALEFAVPDTGRTVAPTARVVWRRPQAAELTPGMGLQFLKLDRDLAQWIDDYVYEIGRGAAAPPGGGAA